MLMFILFGNFETYTVGAGCLLFSHKTQSMPHRNKQTHMLKMSRWNSKTFVRVFIFVNISRPKRNIVYKQMRNEKKMIITSH